MLDINFIENLLQKEDNSLTSVMAFMSYNPSIGRVLEKNGVKKFQKMILEMVEKLIDINDIEGFDILHKEYVEKIITDIRTSKGSLVSFGQSQKPINVFFKVYLDWARKPNEELRSKILPFLHVPLDSILMKTIKRKDNNWYKDEIKPLKKNMMQEFSLSKIDEEIYYKWQKYFRENYPNKPLIFDVAWALNR